MMNSSREIVKDIRRLEMMPGVTNGKITLKNVPTLLSHLSPWMLPLSCGPYY